MAKVLVTGANGFLGSWVVRKLNQEGHQVKILARRTSDLSELEGLDYEVSYGDVTDLESLKKSLPAIETVFHLAGVSAYKRADRELREKVNVGGTENVLAAMQSSNVSKLVHLSSVVAIGAGFNPKQILNEDSTFNLSHLNLGYFETKRKAEALVLKAVTHKKIDSVILNPSTIYGAGDAKKGSRKMQLKVARGKLPFFPGGGVNVVAAEDCVAGILSAWKKGRTGERYILAGDNLTIRQVFEIIASEAGVEPPKIQIPSWLFFAMGWTGDRLQDFGLKGGLSMENAWTAQLYHWFDNAKAKRELDFNPRPASEAIRGSVRWIKEKGLA